MRSRRGRWRRRRRRRRWRWAGPRDTFNLIRGEEEQSPFCHLRQKQCCQAFLPEPFWIPKYILSSEVSGTCLRSRTPLCPPRWSLSFRSPSSSSPRSACASTPCHLSSGIILTRWRCWTAWFGWLGQLPNINLHFLFGPKRRKS